MADQSLKVTVEVMLPFEEVRSVAAGNRPPVLTFIAVLDSVKSACRAAIDDLQATSATALASDLVDTTLNDSAPADKAVNPSSPDTISDSASTAAVGFKPAYAEDASDSDSDTGSVVTPSFNTAPTSIVPRPNHSAREHLSRMQHDHNGLKTQEEKANWLNSYVAQRVFDAEGHLMLQNESRGWGKLIPPQRLDPTQPQVSRNPFRPDQINAELLGGERKSKGSAMQTGTAQLQLHGGETEAKKEPVEGLHEFTDEEYKEALRLFGPFELLEPRIAHDRCGELQSKPCVSITIQPQVMDKFTIRLPLISTIALLKRFIGQRLSTHELFRQRLTFKGKDIGSHPGLPLIDSKWAGMADHDILTLAWYGIKDGDTVDLELGPKDDPITDYFHATHRA